MIELDMVYVLYFGDVLSQGRREFFQQIIQLMLNPPRKAARAAGKLLCIAWASFECRRFGTLNPTSHLFKHARAYLGVV